MAEKIFSHQAAKCLNCKLLTEEFCDAKGELDKGARHLEDMKRNEKLEDQQLLELQQNIGDLKAKKRLRERKSRASKKD